MNYIYDILLNFKDDYIDFYDWNKSDNIIHVRKIPIIKIKTEDLMNIRNNKVKFSNALKEKIKDKTEIYTSTGIKKLPYALLISDENKVIGINILKSNNKKSSILLDEEQDILEDVIEQEIEAIDYKNILNKEYSELKTRTEKEEDDFIRKELNKIKNDKEKLKYLYLECFNVKEKDINKIYIDLLSISDKNKKNTLVNFFKLKNV